MQGDEMAGFWRGTTFPFRSKNGHVDILGSAIPEWMIKHPAALVTVQVFGSILLSFIAVRAIDFMTQYAARKEKEREQSPTGATPPLIAAVRLTVMALHTPVRVFLIIHAFLHVSSVLFNFLRVEFTPRPDGWQASMVHILSKMFRGGDLLADRVFEVLTVVFASWVLLRLKDRWVQQLLDKRAKSGPSSRALSREVDQVLLPLSSVLSWVTVVAGFVMSLNVLGINLMPLATAGLGSGVVLGFASQSVLSNVVAGCNLLITRPMVVGDRVTLRGAAEVVGVVERVDFTRTIIRDDWDVPVSVPNKVLTEAIILNESRSELSPVREHYGGPRQLHLRLKLRSKDLAVCPDLVKAIKRYLITECDGVDVMLPVYCAVTSAMEDPTITLAIAVSATPLAARSFMAFRQRILFATADIIKEHGAEVANNVHAQVIMEDRENISQVGLPM
ncbi:hypothetical protein WJX73_005993 [Symbiochloris irregularis]|uniref:Mechanosensitive ion channel MscS domain-containing protein n=1 Tax=Symbiochloris irregularis TaxID=706552 RepID=A0AAW1NLX6_9CHLO